MRKFKGGGGSSQPTEQTVYSTDLPEYVEPYFKRLLQRGEAESLQGYTPYGGQRLSYFSPDELTSQAMTRGFATAGTPQAYTDALTRYGAQGDISSGYQAGDVSSGYDPSAFAPSYRAGTLQSGYGAGQFDPGYQAGAMGPGYQGATYGSGYQAGAFDPGYQAQLRGSQYQAGQGPAAYSPEQYEQNIQRFMSPYQQNVIDIQKREATRQSDIQSKSIADAAISQGGLGGYREAIMQSERERNLGQRLGDIQERGSQAGFESAQRQLDRERAASMGAAQFGLQRFGAQEQAAQAQEKFGQGAFAQTQQAMQASGAQGIQAYQAGEQARQKAAALGLTAQQQEEAARQAQEKYTQSAFAQTEQGRQKQAQLEATAYQIAEQAKQQAARLGLSAEEIEQRGKQAQEKYMQSAYDLSSRYGLSAAEGLMQTGQASQQDALSRIGALEGVGRQQRALQQAGLDMGYQDFLRQQDWTQRQLGMFGGLLRGVPVQPQQTISTYQQQPGLFQSALGAGLSGLGLYRGMGGG